MGRQFLQALRTSDTDTIARLALPDVGAPMISKYTVLRESPCQETLNMPEVQPELQVFFAAIEKKVDDVPPGKRSVSEIRAAYDEVSRIHDQAWAQLRAAHPCLAKLLNAPKSLIPKDAWSTLDGHVVVHIHEMVVDIDGPNESGAPIRERRQLWLGRLDAGPASRGWKVIGLNPFHP
jgi:hypothetical protein